ncbi:hypothetical protein FRC08_014386 [Ceratobasidium sp. 394]|nr:hypothetical protein FRC08_014386 [Ceratobasidium sp. 394]
MSMLALARTRAPAASRSAARARSPILESSPFLTPPLDLGSLALPPVLGRMCHGSYVHALTLTAIPANGPHSLAATVAEVHHLTIAITRPVLTIARALHTRTHVSRLAAALGGEPAHPTIRSRLTGLGALYARALYAHRSRTRAWQH